MGKIIVNFDINDSSVKFYINNVEVDDIFSLLIHRDITNSYKYSMEIVSGDGITSIKNGKVSSNKNDNVFIEKFLSYFERGKNEWNCSI